MTVVGGTPEILSNEELLLVLRAAAVAGFHTIRLTGGELTLRPEIAELVRAIKAIPGIEQIAMTTNALRLREIAGPLKMAGLDRSGDQDDAAQSSVPLNRWRRQQPRAADRPRESLSS